MGNAIIALFLFAFSPIVCQNPVQERPSDQHEAIGWTWSSSPVPNAWAPIPWALGGNSPLPGIPPGILSGHCWPGIGKFGIISPLSLAGPLAAKSGRGSSNGSSAALKLEIEKWVPVELSNGKGLAFCALPQNGNGNGRKRWTKGKTLFEVSSSTDTTTTFHFFSGPIIPKSLSACVGQSSPIQMPFRLLQFCVHRSIPIQLNFCISIFAVSNFP